MHKLQRITRLAVVPLYLALILAGCGRTTLDPELAVASTGAIRNNSGFNTTGFAANDDLSTGVVPIGFTANFFGSNYTQLYVNNNGNVTFDDALWTYTPFDLTSTGRVIIAPFFADVDTRGSGSNIVRYGTDTVDGRAAFGVNWIDVGFFSYRSHRLNSFQLVLIDRSDIAAGDFDIEFNYEKILWETGEASGGTSDGLGGYSARAGYSNGTGDPGTFYELPGSAVNGAFLDANATTGLVRNSLNSTQTGRYLFEVRSGIIVPPTDNEPPVVDAGGPYSGIVDSAISLSGAAASDPDGDALAYSWSVNPSAGCTFSNATALNPAVTCTSVGYYTLTLAVDDGINPAVSDTASLHVMYDFNGFFPPVNNLPVVNTVRAGQAIPVKFSLNGDYGLGIFEAGSPKVTRYNCESGVPQDPVEETVTAGRSSLSYDAATDQYVYAWKSDRAWSNSCRELQVFLIDGTVRTARFRFTK